MKRLVFLCVSVCLGALLACQTNVPTISSHSVRVKNLYVNPVYECKVGTLSYGTVASGATTAYQGVSEGSQTFTGRLITGASINGTFTISGTGTHLWTVTISSSASVSAAED